MNEQTNRKPRPEIRGKVLAVMPEWQNGTGTFWKREIVIETGFRFPSPIKVTFQKEGTSHLDGVEEGDDVVIPYVLNGRKWDGPNGTQYFVDIVGMGLTKIAGAGGGEAERPVLGSTAEAAVEAWSKKHGEDKAGFAEFCKSLKPGKASKSYTIADWADVVNAINKADETEAADKADPEDLPF